MKIVLDTSAIIKDPTCFMKYGKDDVFVPLVVVEELDAIKEGKGETAAAARSFIKYMDAMSTGKLVKYPGFPIGEGKGSLSVVFHPDNMADIMLGKNIDYKKADNEILSACVYVDVFICRESGEEVVLISEDRNLRFKARVAGISSKGVELQGNECRQQGATEINDVPAGIIDDLYSSSHGVDPAIVGCNPKINEYLILRNGSMSVLAVYQDDGMVRRVKNKDAFGITAKNAEQHFAINALCNPAIPLVAMTGKAGTGKTLLALAAAIDQRQLYRQILLSRPIVQLGNDIGFLPGDLKEKLAPYMQPLFDNLSVIKHAGGNGAAEKIADMTEKEKIVVEPLTYIRGRSLSRAFLIVDEAQNLTPHEVKTIVTRAGEGTKVVFTGDVEQIDACKLDADSNGLAYLSQRLTGQKLYAHVNLQKGERSALAEMASELL